MVAFIYTMFPTLITLFFLWRNGELGMLCWIISGMAIISWYAGNAFIKEKRHIDSGNRSRLKSYSFWSATANVTMWLLVLLCISFIIVSFIVKS